MTLMPAPNYASHQLLSLLHQAKIRPSVHRMAVLQYVVDKRTHPTADEIFSALSAELPSLSRATIYNSLHILVDGGILRELEIENGLTRYDFALQLPHGHFMCRKCGKIYDMSIPCEAADTLPDGFSVESVDIFAKGYCPDCCNMK